MLKLVGFVTGVLLFYCLYGR